jgi:hypothetical protein
MSDGTTTVVNVRRVRRISIKATSGFVMSDSPSDISLSVRPHGTTRLPLDGFSQNFVFGSFSYPKVTWKSPFSAKFLGHFSPIVPPSGARFARVASDAGILLWRKLERSKFLVLLQVGGLTCRWQRHSVKPSC